MTARLLLIEDDEALAALSRQHLVEQGFGHVNNRIHAIGGIPQAT